MIRVSDLVCIDPDRDRRTLHELNRQRELANWDTKIIEEGALSIMKWW